MNQDTPRMKFEDINQRKHVLHVVRSMGPGHRFGVLNVLTNVFVDYSCTTRDEAWEALKACERKLEDN